jgi:hypothetical protein
MEAQRMGISLTPEERFEVFGNWSPDDYAEEAKERWGDTEAYQQSHRRTASYTKEDWLKIKREGAEIDRRFVSALQDGVPATSEKVMDIAEAHRRQINSHFYDCSYAMHRGLADMFVSEPRFRARYQDIAPGLGEFVAAAIRANAERAGDS